MQTLFTCQPPRLMLKSMIRLWLKYTSHETMGRSCDKKIPMNELEVMKIKKILKHVQAGTFLHVTHQDGSGFGQIKVYTQDWCWCYKFEQTRDSCNFRT